MKRGLQGQGFKPKGLEGASRASRGAGDFKGLKDGLKGLKGFERKLKEALKASEGEAVGGLRGLEEGFQGLEKLQGGGLKRFEKGLQGLEGLEGFKP